MKPKIQSAKKEKSRRPFDGPLVGKGYEIRIQPGEDWIDEVFAENCRVHVEQMDTNAFWMGITFRDGSRVCINFWTRRAPIFTSGLAEPSPLKPRRHP